MRVMPKRVRLAASVIALLSLLLIGDALAAGSTCAMHLQIRNNGSACGN